ncbi:hypothetical protein K9N68_37350 (plasmid) [Kovacikia minuta CCNUW1]|uniref:hypothetical protein n=1 Tax=Kovacikia minuta TaxID=2931930 RepID=UPI001CCD6A01|nr:hypothetical protein [Kovacikia minuta]UBF29880.1 hypothetical protein K9N68_37350 [Kovacikia minuta CCNUW1]
MPAFFTLISSLIHSLVDETWNLWVSPPYLPELILLVGLLVQFHPCLCSYRHNFHKAIVIVKVAMTFWTVSNAIF